MNRAVAGETLTVYEPGTHPGNFIHVKDVARAYVDSCERLLEQLDRGETGVEKYEIASDEDERSHRRQTCQGHRRRYRRHRRRRGAGREPTGRRRDTRRFVHGRYRADDRRSGLDARTRRRVSDSDGAGVGEHVDDESRWIYSPDRKVTIHERYARGGSGT